MRNITICLFLIAVEIFAQQTGFDCNPNILEKKDELKNEITRIIKCNNADQIELWLFDLNGDNKCEIFVWPHICFAAEGTPCDGYVFQVNPLKLISKNLKNWGGIKKSNKMHNGWYDIIDENSGWVFIYNGKKYVKKIKEGK